MALIRSVIINTNSIIFQMSGAEYEYYFVIVITLKYLKLSNVIVLWTNNNVFSNNIIRRPIRCHVISWTESQMSERHIGHSVSSFMQFEQNPLKYKTIILFALYPTFYEGFNMELNYQFIDRFSCALHQWLALWFTSYTEVIIIIKSYLRTYLWPHGFSLMDAFLSKHKVQESSLTLNLRNNSSLICLKLIKNIPMLCCRFSFAIK